MFSGLVPLKHSKFCKNVSIYDKLCGNYNSISSVENPPSIKK